MVTIAVIVLYCLVSVSAGHIKNNIVAERELVNDPFSSLHSMMMISDTVQGLCVA